MIAGKRIIIAMLAIAGACAGCREAGPPARVRAPNQMPFRSPEGEVMAGAEPIVTPGKSLDTFGTDVTGEFIAVVVGVRNDLEEHVLVNRKEVELRASDGTVSRPVSWRALRSEFKDDLGLAPLFGAAAEESERERNEDRIVRWQAMELDDQLTIEGKGRGGGGFLYFRRQTLGAPPHQLVIRVQKLKSSEDLEVAVEIPTIPRPEADD